MKHLVYWLVVGLTVLFSSPTLAQITTLDPVVVTATRTSTPISQLGSSVTVVTREEIEEKQQTQVLEVLRSVNGVSVVQSGPLGGQTSILMRGTDNRHTLILIDGVEFRDASLIGGGANLANISTQNIERIEIVRGPQSVIYGSDAIGGVINIITRKGSQGTEGYASVEGGSYNTWHETAGFSFGDQKTNAAFTFSKIDSDGFSSLNENDGFTEKDGYSNRSLSFNLHSELNSAFALNLNFNRIDAENDFDDSFTPQDYDIATKSAETIGRAEGLFTLWEDKLKSLAAVSVTKVNRKTSGPESWDNYDYEGTVTKLELQNTLLISSFQTVVFGLETEKEEYKSSSSGSSDVRTNSIYLQDQIGSGPFSAAIGLRHDEHEQFGGETTWRVAPTYLFQSTNTRIMASAGSGYKAPSLYQLYGKYISPFFSSDLGNPNLKPETSLGLDVGLEQSLFNNNFILSVTWFYNDIEDYIDWSGSTYRNVKKLKTKGIESSVEWFPIDGINTKLAYTYTDTEDENGNDKARIPQHKASADINLYPIDAVQLNANILYVGQRADGATVEILADYLLLNLAASYQLNASLKLFGRIDNLLDTEYEEAAGYGTAGLSAYTGLNFSF